MFGQKPPISGPVRDRRSESEKPTQIPARPSASSAAAAIPSRPMPGPATRQPGTFAIPGLGSARGGEPVPLSPKREECQLFVGKGVRLTGEILESEQIVILGTVEATIKGSKALGIAEGGLFSGVAEVEEADISGTFDGTLTVNGRLVVREAGLVTGEVRYNELEIQRGGRLVGDIQAKDDAPAAAQSAKGKTKTQSGK